MSSLLLSEMIIDDFHVGNFDYSSEIWDHPAAQPSEVLIVPFVGLIMEYEVQRVVIDTGCRKSMETLKEVGPMVDKFAVILEREDNFLAEVQSLSRRLLACLESENINKLPEAELNTIHNSLQAWNDAIPPALRSFKRRAKKQELLVVFYNKSLTLLHNLKVLGKIHHSLRGIHEIYGREYASSQQAVMKLTVCMKCFDAAWKGTRTAYKEMKAAQQQMERFDERAFVFAGMGQYDEMKKLVEDLEAQSA